MFGWQCSDRRRGVLDIQYLLLLCAVSTTSTYSISIPESLTVPWESSMMQSTTLCFTSCACLCTTRYAHYIPDVHWTSIISLLQFPFKAGAHDIPNVMPSGVFPFILVLYTVYHLIFPLRTRCPMWKTIWSVVMAPSTSPSFFDGYVGDIFTSMVKVFQDIAWTTCFIFSGDWLIDEDVKRSSRHLWAHTFWYKNILMPFICLLPLVFRFNQCLRKFHDTGKRLPHLANASKYALSQTVTLFGAFHPLYLMHKNPESHRINLFQLFWTCVFVASSLYSFTWDVYMDWGLGLPKYQFLGPRLMYPRRVYYYYVIALDLGEAICFAVIRGITDYVSHLLNLPLHLKLGQFFASCGF